MELTIVGNWSPYPRNGEACSGYILQQGSSIILLDCGHGAFSNLSNYVDPLQLNAVFISHFHPDHCADLQALRHFMRGAFIRGERTQPLAVFLPDDKQGDLTYWQQIEELDIIIIQNNGSYRMLDMELSFHRMRHSVLTYGIKAWTEQKCFFYTADTSLDESLIRISQGVDLLLAETTFRSFEQDLAAKTGHMTTADAVYWAQQAGARKLLATHFWPGFDQLELQRDLAAQYEGQFDMARAGLKVQI